MFFLHAASLALLVFVIGMASSIATTTALRGWAINTFDAPADGDKTRHQASSAMYKVGYSSIGEPGYREIPIDLDRSVAVMPRQPLRAATPTASIEPARLQD